MQVEVLAVLLLDTIDDLLVVRRTERRADQGLRLATGEQHGTVLARDEVGHDRDLANLVPSATVDAAAGEDLLTLDLLLEVVEEVLHLFRLGLQIVAVETFRERCDAVLADLVAGIVTNVLAVDADRTLERVLELEDLGLQIVVERGSDMLHLGLAGDLLDLVDQRDDVLDRVAGHLERVDHLGLGQLLGGTLHHRQAVLVARNDEVEARVRATVLVGRERDEFAVDVRDAHGAEAGVEGQAGDADGGEGRDHREDVRVVRAVVLQHVGHHLDLGLVAVREHGPDRAIDHAHGQDFLGGRATFTLEEAAGDLARRLGLLAVVADQGEEVDVFAGLARGHRCEDLGLAERGDDGTASLAGHLAGLEGDVVSGDLRRDALVSVHHVLVSRCYV